MQISLRLAIWNANGLAQHRLEVEHFLKANHIDILLCSETHFTNRSFFQISGYDMINTNRPDGLAYGGAAVLIKSTLDFTAIEPTAESWAQVASVKLYSNLGDVIVSAAYFPPRYSVTQQMFAQVFGKLGHCFFLGGDFNAKHQWWGSRSANTKGRELHKCILNNNLYILSGGQPTFWPTNTNILPDLIDFVVYKGIASGLLNIENNFDLTSDHSALIVNLNQPVNLKISSRRLIKKNTNFDLYRSLLANVDHSIDLTTESNVDDAVDLLMRSIQVAATLSTPVQTTQRTAYNNNFSLRTPAVAAMVLEKRRLRRVWQLSRNPRDKTALNKASKDLKAMLSELRCEALKEFLASAEPNGEDHNLWNSTRYLKRPSKRLAPIKRGNNQWCRSHAETAEEFSKHLSNAFTPFDICSAADEAEIDTFLSIPCQMDVPIRATDNDELLAEISRLKNSKSPGFDNIDGRALKELPINCIQLISAIFNSCLKLNYFPSQWKQAEIVMILKPNNPDHLPESYRPISLLAILSKLFERILLRRMLPILEDHIAIPDHQFGFRSRHGTPEQIHRIVQTILSAFETKQYCSAVFLDVKQAFDKVWHKGLLYKLKTLLPSPFYLLLKSYLSNRSFRVLSGSVKSATTMIRAGVPQGSVLGPVLYTIYTSDLPLSPSNNILVATYADDTAILSTAISPVEASINLQQYLNHVEKWLDKWNIAVNKEKSNHVTFSLRRGDCDRVSLHAVTIPANQEVNYLGVTLDRRLTWKAHIKCKRKMMKLKRNRMLWLLGSRSQLKLEYKVLLYKAIIKPIWTYAIQLWGSACKSSVESIQKEQNITLRVITGAPWYVRNDNLHKDLNVSTVAEEITNFCHRYQTRLENHPNLLANGILDKYRENMRRLKRKHPLDPI